jgi:integrase
VRHRKVSINPCTGVWHPGAPKARERVLSDAEIGKLWRATDAIDVRFGAALKLLLLLGARLNEVVGMRHSELSEDGTWTIPSNRAKNHRAHRLVLPKLALDIIAAVPRIEGDLVFTSTGRAPISGWSKMKKQLDAAMGDVPPWRIHDLRRTCASGMQRLGVRTEVIERALNHVSGSYSGVAGVYQRDALTPEVAAALLRWAQHVSGLVIEKPSNVRELRAGS